MMNTRHIKIADYNYDLPDSRIAKYPLAERDHSKLLIYNKGVIAEDVFSSLPNHLPAQGVMVFNNTKVIQARLHFRKLTGAHIEVFLLEPAMPADYEQNFHSRGQCDWYCLIGNLKKWKEGVLTADIPLAGDSAQTITLHATMVRQHGTSFQVHFEWSQSDLSFSELIDAAGELPIPPYLNRSTEESDKITYQTVYSKIKGSVAAPTAGLHFTPQVLNTIRDKGLLTDEVTLHVGAGTFKPVKSEEIADHEMHSEFFFVKRQTIVDILANHSHAIAVGTTSVRTLESLYYIGCQLEQYPQTDDVVFHVNQWEPYSAQTSQPITPTRALENILGYLDSLHLDFLRASTQIIIAPGYDYKIVNMLITNFHQPQSTLLLLVSAFVKGDWKSIYNYALAHDFRFLSYGDSSLIIP